MKTLKIVIVTTLLTMAVSLTATAQPIELSVGASPVFHQDPALEAFSSDDLNTIRAALDARVQVLNLNGFKLLPTIGYRYATDMGSPYHVLDTELDIHDFVGGLRVRKGIFSFAGVFLEATGGVTLTKMNAEPSFNGEYTAGSYDRGDYKDQQVTWVATGLAGLEFYLPKSWMVSRGVKRFNFGAEIGAGYARRGNLEFNPDVTNDQDYAIDMQTSPWGELNLSGVVFQIGACLKFL